MNYYIECFKKYAIFKGRSARKEYWMFQLFHIIITTSFWLAVILLSFVTNTPWFVIVLFSILWLVYLIWSLIPLMAVTFRRLHDSWKSWWWFILSFIPIIWIIPMICTLVFTLVWSNKWDNKYWSQIEWSSTKTWYIFSLIFIALILMIISILWIIIKFMWTQWDVARDTWRIRDLLYIDSALISYYDENGSYPESNWECVNILKWIWSKLYWLNKLYFWSWEKKQWTLCKKHEWYYFYKSLDQNNNLNEAYILCANVEMYKNVNAIWKKTGVILNDVNVMDASFEYNEIKWVINRSYSQIAKENNIELGERLYCIKRPTYF